MVVSERGTIHEETVKWMKKCGKVIDDKAESIFKLHTIQYIMTVVYRTFILSGRGIHTQDSIEEFNGDF